jgi:hypothetical protein
VDRARKVGSGDSFYSLSEVLAATMGERYEQANGKTMMKNSVLCAAIVGSSTVLLSSAVAQGDPATPMPVNESSAAQLCGAESISSQP